MEEDLKKNGRRPQKNKMEDNLKREKKKKKKDLKKWKTTSKTIWKTT